jgi:aspartate/methionine/tyrosine aminotransferase
VRVNLPDFWHWEGSGAERQTYDLSESCMRPPSLHTLPLHWSAEQSAPYLAYGDPDGAEALRSAIAALYPGARAQDVLITAGATEANFLALSTLCEPGDRVIVATPTYQPLYEVPRARGASVSWWQPRLENNWRPDVAELRRLLERPARLVIINFPNNPTGATVDREFLEATSDLCREHGALLYADEVYRGLALSDAAGQPSSWDVAPGETVVVGSFSKTYGLPGLRVGWLLAPPHVRAGVRRTRAYTSISQSVLSEALAIRVLSVGDALLSAQRAHARRNLEHVAAFINHAHHRLSWVPPAEGAVGFVRYACRLPSTEFARRLADRWHTLVVPGACFGYEQHVRVGFGGDTETLLHGLRQLGNFVAAL